MTSHDVSVAAERQQGAFTSAVLSRELAYFVVELSIALHKHAIYPDGHPALVASRDSFARRLSELLENRRSLAVGVARDQLIIEGVATDPRNPLLRGLARHLNRHRLGAVRFLAGASDDEIAEALRTLAADPERGGQPLGLAPPAALSRWEHVVLFPVSYEHLELAEEGDPNATESETARTAQLWLSLASAALQAGTEQLTGAETDSTNPETDGSESSENDQKSPAARAIETDPAKVAQAINTHVREAAYDQVIVGYLLQIAGELRDGDQPDTVILRRRVSRLVEELEPQALRRLLEMGGDLEQRRAFVMDVSQGMGADSVMPLLKAAADSSNQVISHSLARLLAKLAAHAQRGAEPLRPQADAALREHVRKLVSTWTLPDPNPSGYAAVLSQMARTAPVPAASAESVHGCEPERVIEMSLEVGSFGAQVAEAVDTLLARGDVGALFDLMGRAPEENEASRAIGERLAQPEQLHTLVGTSSLDAERLGRFVCTVGPIAADPLLDVLATAQSRAVRRRALDLLVQLGPGIGPRILSRLENAPWFLIRNLLVLVQRLPEVPTGFTAAPYASHSDPRVRREAVRLLLADQQTRDGAICAAVADTNDQVVRLALSAAIGRCPAAAVPFIVHRLSQRTLDPELSVLAVRALSGADSSAAMQAVIDCALASRSWFRRRRIGPKSPLVLSAISGLATNWPQHPNVAPVLALAARDSDAEIRAAVAGRSAS